MKASDWIGAEGAAFERVCMAFESLGYRKPAPDTPNGPGAYAQNIAAQYQADLSRQDALAVIEYGYRNSRDAIRNRFLSEREIIGMYSR